jgi:FkbM family methyltransferase
MYESGVGTAASTASPVRAAGPRATVAVVIPTFRRRQLLLGLLASLRAGSVVPDEVVVVDNDPDGPVDLSDAPLPVKVIHLGVGLNLAKARNTGWRATTADVCIFVDDDNVVDPGMVAALLAAIETPGVGLVTPVIYAGDSDRVWLGGTSRSVWTGITRCQYHGRSGLPDADTWPTHGAPDLSAVRRDVLEETGGFEEHRFPMGEDEADLFMRLTRRGLTSVVVKQAVARHHGFVTENPGEALVRATMIHGPERVRLMTRGRVWYQRVHSPLLTKVTTLGVFIPLWATGTALACLLVRAPFSARRRAVAALAGGLREGYREALPASVDAGLVEVAPPSVRAPGIGTAARRLARLAAASRRAFRRWYLICPAAAIVAPSMIPPRRGLPRLAGHSLTVRLRSGPRITCRLNEVFNVFETFGMECYDIEGVPWAALDTIVDVGANIGSTAVWFAQRSPVARVIAIEPGRATASRLRHNIAQAGFEGQVTVVQAGLGAKPGDALLVDTYSSAMAYTVPVPGEEAVPSGPGMLAGERVTIRVLEEVLDALDVDRVDLLKLDCEGAEYDVILSASDACLARIDRIVGEYNNVPGVDPRQMFRRLADAGFVVTDHPEVADESFDLELFADVVTHGETAALGMFTAVRGPG